MTILFWAQEVSLLQVPRDYNTRWINVISRSGILNCLRFVFSGVQSFEWLYVYGDAGYYASLGVTGEYRAFPRKLITNAQKSFNKCMSSQRSSVEQVFGHILQQWSFNCHRLGLLQGNSPVASFYLISVFLTNVLRCLRGGNLISTRFSCPPPSISDYLRRKIRDRFCSHLLGFNDIQMFLNLI